MNDKVNPTSKLLSTIDAKPLDWVVQGWCAVGKVTAVIAEAGAGGSLFAAEVAARVSAGVDFPRAIGRVSAGNVLLLSDDNDPSERVRPRLEVAGADLGKIIFQPTKGENVRHADFALSQCLEDLPLISAMILDFKESWSSSKGKKSLDVVLSELRDFARDKSIAVVLILPLAASGTARVQQIATQVSVAFELRRGAGNSRNVLPLKNTLAADLDAFSFSISSRETESNVTAAVIEWEGCFPVSSVRSSANTAYSARRAVARNFVEDQIFDGKLSRELLSAGKAIGLSEDMISDAAKHAGYEVKREGGSAGKGHWVWRKVQSGKKQQK